MKRAGRIAAAAAALLLVAVPALLHAADARRPPERPERAREAGDAPAGGPAPVAGEAAAGAEQLGEFILGDWGNAPVLVFADFSWWWEAPTTPEVAAKLFAETCLATLPDFAGAGPLFEYLGFVGVPGMRIRNHFEKKMSALATVSADLRAGGSRSCAVLAEGFGESPATRAVEPIIAARFGKVPRHDVSAEGIEHVVWTVATAAGPVRISVTESAGEAYIGATLLPRAGVAAQ